MNILLNRINTAQAFAVQNVQNQEGLYLADTVPANSQKLARKAVSNLGHFQVREIKCSYTTVAAGPADTGIDYLRAKLIDGASMKSLFDDFIPFHLWAVPGRRRSLVGGGAGGESFQAQIVFPWEYMFTVNSDILLDVKNDSAVANSYSVLFIGVRVKSTSV